MGWMVAGMLWLVEMTGTEMVGGVLLLLLLGEWDAGMEGWIWD